MKPSILILLASVVLGCGNGGTEPGMEGVPPAFLATWGDYGDDDGEFYQPFDIAVGPDGSIYVTDIQNRRVQRFTDDGVFISKWELATFLEVYAIAVDETDVVYVRGWWRFGISRFSSNGENLGALGGWAGRGIAVGADGSIYVAGYNHVTKLAEDGTVETSWTPPLEEESERFHPNAIAHDEDEGTYVVGAGWGSGARTEVSLWKFGHTGELVWKESFDTDLDLLGVATDSKGNVYVTSATEGKIKKFSRNGIFLMEWSEVSPNDEPLDYPTGIAVDAEDNVYVTDFRRDRVVKFGTND